MNAARFLLYSAMSKTADLRPGVELMPHQQRVVEKVKREPAVLVYHPVGTGKTLASIAAGEQLPGPKQVIVPASLRENYRKELAKFLRGKPSDYSIRSYSELGEGKPLVESPALTVLDEAQRMGSEGTSISTLPGRIKGKTMLMSGTPVRNDPAEMVPLLQLLAQGRHPPASVAEFKRRFIREETVRPGL